MYKLNVSEMYYDVAVKQVEILLNRCTVGSYRPILWYMLVKYSQSCQQTMLTLCQTEGKNPLLAVQKT